MAEMNVNSTLSFTEDCWGEEEMHVDDDLRSYVLRLTVRRSHVQECEEFAVHIEGARERGHDKASHLRVGSGIYCEDSAAGIRAHAFARLAQNLNAEQGAHGNPSRRDAALHLREVLITAALRHAVYGGGDAAAD